MKEYGQFDYKFDWYKPFQDYMRLNNSLSVSDAQFKYTIDTLTQIDREVLTHAKYYTVDPMEFFYVRPGRAAFQDTIVRNLIADVVGDFETGIVNTGSNVRRPQAEIAIKQKSVPVKVWNEEINYNLIEVQQAQLSTGIDIILKKSESRKKHWDLGIQKIAFLGSLAFPGITGLLTASDVEVDTTLLTQFISKLNPDDFAGLVATLLAAYFTNTNSTQLPTNFVIPMDDYLGLAAPVSPTFPNISKLEYLTNAFKLVTQGKGVKISGLAYANKAQMATVGVNKNRYVLYNNDKETIQMDLPLPFTTTAFGTSNNFTFQNVAYGQFTGCNVYRAKEVYYLDVE